MVAETKVRATFGRPSTSLPRTANKLYDYGTLYSPFKIRSNSGAPTITLPNTLIDRAGERYRRFLNFDTDIITLIPEEVGIPLNIMSELGMEYPIASLRLANRKGTSILVNLPSGTPKIVYDLYVNSKYYIITLVPNPYGMITRGKYYVVEHSRRNSVGIALPVCMAEQVGALYDTYVNKNGIITLIPHDLLWKDADAHGVLYPSRLITTNSHQSTRINVPYECRGKEYDVVVDPETYIVTLVPTGREKK